VTRDDPVVTGGAGAGAVAVLGLGNVLMEDDALGPHVIDALRRGFEFPEDVILQDLGTPGLDLAPFLSGLRAAIFVDTVASGDPPGTVRIYRREEILKVPPQPRLSPHDPALKETLLALDFEGSAPREVVLVGVVPKSTMTRMGLNPEIRQAIPAAVAEVLRELARLGVAARPTVAHEPGPAWWEASTA
jgi:hydrogenase maturation protease